MIEVMFSMVVGKSDFQWRIKNGCLLKIALMIPQLWSKNVES